jgi:ribosome-associated protein
LRNGDARATLPRVEDLVVDSRVTIAARHLSWAASRSGGPGGQNVNKVSSKVEVRFDVDACESLTEAQKTRLRTIGRGKLDADGRLLITSQESRDQPKNLDTAREKLAELVRAALFVPKVRRPTKPSRGAKLRRLGDKKMQGDKKRARGAHRGDE